MKKLLFLMLLAAASINAWSQGGPVFTEADQKETGLNGDQLMKVYVFGDYSFKVLTQTGDSIELPYEDYASKAKSGLLGSIPLPGTEVFDKTKMYYVVKNPASPVTLPAGNITMILTVPEKFGLIADNKDGHEMYYDRILHCMSVLKFDVKKKKRECLYSVVKGLKPNSYERQTNDAIQIDYDKIDTTHYRITFRHATPGQYGILFHQTSMFTFGVK